MERDTYGARETSPLDAATRDFIERAHASGRIVEWNDPQLKRIVRLRLLSDPGFPVWDVSYCVGEMRDGTPVRVDLPFNQVPRRGMMSFLVQAAARDGVHAKRLGVFDALSTLV